MGQLAALAPYIGIATAALGAYSQIESGKAAAANQHLQAIQDERDANAAQVEAQGVAFNERRRAKILRSRALAVAGASGAGVSDPTVVNILGDIDAEGEVRALNALYEGDYLAQGLRSGAKSRRAMGSALRTAGNLNATATLAGGVSTFAEQNPSFFQKYG